VSNQEQIQIIEQESQVVATQKVPLIAFPETPIHQKEHESFFIEALDQIKPDLVHIHHLLNWPFGILELLNERNIPFVLSLHDYYLLTPHFTMQGVTDPKVTLGSNYSTKIFGVDISKYLRDRRAYLKENIASAKKIIAPSKYIKKTFQSIFSEDVVIVPHAIEEKEFKDSQQCKKSFGFIGSFLPQKGIQILIDAYKIYRSQNGTFDLELFGGDISALGLEQINGINSYGVYDSEDLGSISSKFSVGIIPSIFPESFCLTLSELWQMNKPVISFAIGALEERLKAQQNGGWLVYDLTPQALASKMLEVQEISSNSSQFEVNAELPSLSGMIKSYNKIYSQAVGQLIA
jgi:glycosyltransferase involved in cell wall biosynthesis